VSTAATLPRSGGAANHKSVVPAAAVGLFGMVGAASGVDGTKEVRLLDRLLLDAGGEYTWADVTRRPTYVTTTLEARLRTRATSSV
jgi:hypothetical protein